MNAQPKENWAWQASFVTMPVDCLPIGVPLPFPLYLCVNEKPILFHPANKDLSAARAARLVQQTDCVYLPKANWSDANRFFRETNNWETLREVDVLRTLLFVEMKDVQERMELSPMALARLQSLSARLGRLIGERPQQAEFLIRRYKEPALYSLTHDLNVACYTALVLNSMGSSVAEIQRVFLAALLQNCGVLAVPREIVAKPGPLSAEEWQEMRRHPTLGARMLRELNLPDEITQVSEQHHERCDGSGYPNGLKGEQISRDARASAAADCFDAMQSARPHAAARSLIQAREELRAQGNRYDEAIVALLLQLKI